MAIEPWCNHKKYQKGCKPCFEARHQNRDDQAEIIEAAIIKSYEEGGFRGITKLFMDREALK